MNVTTKRWIDEASYEMLLNKWRFANIGDPMFQGESGEYYKKAMLAKKSVLPDGGVSASKRIGW